MLACETRGHHTHDELGILYHDRPQLFAAPVGHRLEALELTWCSCDVRDDPFDEANIGDLRDQVPEQGLVRAAGRAKHIGYPVWVKFSRRVHLDTISIVASPFGGAQSNRRKGISVRLWAVMETGFTVRVWSSTTPGSSETGAQVLSG